MFLIFILKKILNFLQFLYYLCKEIMKNFLSYIILYPFKFMLRIIIFFSLIISDAIWSFIKNIIYKIIFFIIYLINYISLRILSLKFIVLKFKDTIFNYKKKNLHFFFYKNFYIFFFEKIFKLTFFFSYFFIKLFFSNLYFYFKYIINLLINFFIVLFIFFKKIFNNIFLFFLSLKIFFFKFKIYFIKFIRHSGFYKIYINLGVGYYFLIFYLYFSIFFPLISNLEEWSFNVYFDPFNNNFDWYAPFFRFSKNDKILFIGDILETAEFFVIKIILSFFYFLIFIPYMRQFFFYEHGDWEETTSEADMDDLEEANEDEETEDDFDDLILDPAAPDQRGEFVYEYSDELHNKSYILARESNNTYTNGSFVRDEGWWFFFGVWLYFFYFAIKMWFFPAIPRLGFLTLASPEYEIESLEEYEETDHLKRTYFYSYPNFNFTVFEPWIPGNSLLSDYKWNYNFVSNSTDVYYELYDISYKTLSEKYYNSYAHAVWWPDINRNIYSYDYPLGKKYMNIKKFHYSPSSIIETSEDIRKNPPLFLGSLGYYNILDEDSNNESLYREKYNYFVKKREFNTIDVWNNIYGNYPVSNRDNGLWERSLNYQRNYFNKYYNIYTTINYWPKEESSLFFNHSSSYTSLQKDFLLNYKKNILVPPDYSSISKFRGLYPHFSLNRMWSYFSLKKDFFFSLPLTYGSYVKEPLYMSYVKLYRYPHNTLISKIYFDSDYENLELRAPQRIGYFHYPIVYDYGLSSTFLDFLEYPVWKILFSYEKNINILNNAVLSNFFIKILAFYQKNFNFFIYKKLLLKSWFLYSESLYEGTKLKSLGSYKNKINLFYMKDYINEDLLLDGFDFNVTDVSREENTYSFINKFFNQYEAEIPSYSYYSQSEYFDIDPNNDPWVDFSEKQTEISLPLLDFIKQIKSSNYFLNKGNYLKDLISERKFMWFGAPYYYTDFNAEKVVIGNKYKGRFHNLNKNYLISEGFPFFTHIVENTDFFMKNVKRYQEIDNSFYFKSLYDTFFDGAYSYSNVLKKNNHMEDYTESFVYDHKKYGLRALPSFVYSNDEVTQYEAVRAAFLANEDYKNLSYEEKSLSVGFYYNSLNKHLSYFHFNFLKSNSSLEEKIFNFYTSFLFKEWLSDYVNYYLDTEKLPYQFKFIDNNFSMVKKDEVLWFDLFTYSQNPYYSYNFFSNIIYRLSLILKKITFHIDSLFYTWDIWYKTEKGSPTKISSPFYPLVDLFLKKLWYKFLFFYFKNEDKNISSYYFMYNDSAVDDKYIFRIVEFTNKLYKYEVKDINYIDTSNNFIYVDSLKSLSYNDSYDLLDIFMKNRNIFFKFFYKSFIHSNNINLKYIDSFLKNYDLYVLFDGLKKNKNKDIFTLADDVFFFDRNTKNDIVDILLKYDFFGKNRLFFYLKDDFWYGDNFMWYLMSYDPSFLKIRYFSIIFRF